MREMSVAEQRYKAVLAVIAEGRTLTEVARDWGVSRQTMHAWRAMRLRAWRVWVIGRVGQQIAGTRFRRG